MSVDYSEQVWKELAKIYASKNPDQKLFEAKKKEMFSEKVDRVKLFRKALPWANPDRNLAVRLVEELPTSELLELFPEIVGLALVTAYLHLAYDLVRSLPRYWVLANIETVAEALLALPGTDDGDYRRILELYKLLDKQLTLKLAQTASVSTDPYIREAGEDYLKD